MEPTDSPPARRRKGTLRKILYVVGGLFALLVIAVTAAALLVDSTAVAAQLKNRVLPQISERIGRDVDVDTIDVSVLPVPTATLGGVRVEGVEGQPLLASRSARARLDLWPLITSLGKEIRFESVELRGTEVNLVRFPDGTWDYERILDRLEAQQQAETAEPGGTKRAFAVAEVAITDGTVRMIDRSAPGGTATAELSGIEATARHIEPGQPMELDLRAALQSSSPNVEASLRIDPLPEDFAALGPGNWPDVTGSLRVDNAPLATLRNLLPAGLDEVATGGAVHLTGRVSTEDERYVATGTGGIRALQLRGESAQAGFGYTARIDPATKAMEVSLRDIDLEGPGIDMGGTASVKTAPVRFDFALAGPLLDLDALLGVLPEQAEEPKPEESQGIVPPSARRSVEQASGSGTLEVERLVSGNLTANDVKAQATLQKGVLTLERAQAGFYGGTVRADGTTANLIEEVPSWHLVAQMEGVELQEAMDAISGFAPLSGALGSKVDLKGAGTEWEALRDALTGAAALELAEGQLATIDLDQAVAASLVQGLQAIGQSASAERIERGAAATTLRDLRTRVKVDDGWMTLQQPISVNTGFGTMRLDGRIGLDWQLDLKGTAQLSPDFVSQLTGGRLRPSEPVALPMQLGGTLQSPAVGSFDTEQIARALLPTGEVERRVAKEVERGKEKARQEAQRRARDVLKDVF